jgi:[CysO sulfur-carrier protein]-S-L-cysteine hydrolase
LSTPFSLQVPRRLYQEMLDQARAELPNECCGLLAGIIFPENGKRVGRVVQRYSLVNAAAAPKLFESEAKSTFAAHKDMRRCGTDVLAVYHSHPTSAPVPSKTDLERNYSTEVVNLIISLEAEVPSMRGWWLTEMDYREAEWVVLD